LRWNAVTLYGPGGEMNGGKAVLLVGLYVFESSHLDMEYLGCREGTGLMPMQDLEN